MKPQALDKLLVQVAPAIDPHKLVISVAAGVPIAAMERRLGAGARIVRTMPNTPSLVGAGACALARRRARHRRGPDASPPRIFESVGITTVVDENLLDAVTGLSGSGPAYIFLIIEALSDAGVKVGLPRYTALKLAAQTVLGSAKLLIETGAHPGQLKDQVTSPGRHRHRRPAHPGGRRAAHHPHQRGGGRHPPRQGAGRAVPGEVLRAGLYWGAAMKITPLDIRQKRFETALRGFSKREVEAFLELIAGEFEEVVKENIALKEELKRTQLRLEQHLERERTLQETMVTAQRISEDLKAAAKKEAEIILADAEHQAEKIVHGAHQRLVQVVEDINELKRQRVQFESQVQLRGRRAPEAAGDVQRPHLRRQGLRARRGQRGLPHPEEGRSNGE